MIKFFRRIRQRVLNENPPNKTMRAGKLSNPSPKTGRYILYAIGEIILVVLGILIALQINNWNEYSKQIDEEKEILASLEEELKNNIVILEATLKDYKGFENHTKAFIDSIRNNFTYFSAKSLADCFTYVPPQLNTFALEDILKSDRKLKTKKNEFISTLRKLTSLHLDIKKSESYLDESWNSRASEFFIKIGLDLNNRNFKNNRMTLLDLEKGGYTKIQVISLLGLYDELRYSWITSQTLTLKACEEVLELLKNSNE